MKGAIPGVHASCMSTMLSRSSFGPHVEKNNLWLCEGFSSHARPASEGICAHEEGPCTGYVGLDTTSHGMLV